MILALDLGTKMGYALGNGRAPYVSGVMDFAARRYEGGGMRYLRFRRFILDTIKGSGVKEIYFEEVRGHRGTTAAQVYGSFMGVLVSTCEELDIPFSGVSVGTIKKFATGKGNTDKDGMVAAAQAKGWDPSDHNEADALWLLEYAISELGAAVEV